MMREIPKQIFWWVLALVVALFLYGREQRHAGRDMEREQVLRSQSATPYIAGPHHSQGA